MASQPWDCQAFLGVGTDASDHDPARGLGNECPTVFITAPQLFYFPLGWTKSFQAKIIQAVK